MSKERQNALVVSKKQGVAVYASNPSLPDADEIRRNKAVRFGTEKRGFVVNTSDGEVVGFGGANFYEFEEVDSEKFVKMYLAGIKQTAGLSKSGLTIFEIVYLSVQAHPNVDTVNLNFYTASLQCEGLTLRTYQRGLRELLSREVLFRSPLTDTYFINIRCLFNGDRLAFVKGYLRKPMVPNQGQLTLNAPEVDEPAEID